MIADGILALASRTKTLRIPDPARLSRFERVRGIVVVGPTCAGKSTIIDAIRASGEADVPPRFLTRPPRAGDRDAENVHVDAAGMDRLIARGEMGLRWIRPMENGREERYGFPPPRDGRFTVYSANNAIWSNAASIRPEGALRELLVLGVHAPDALREKRMRVRSPDLWRDRPAEVAWRLADRADDLRPHVDLLLDDDEPFESLAPRDAVLLVRALAS